MRVWLIAIVVAVTAAGCEPVNSPWMFPGENCLSCHNPNGQAFGKPWTVGGTIYDSSGDAGVEGAQVVIKDATGTVITLTTNGVGNFYTAETLKAPFQEISVGYGDAGFIQMPIALATGEVNGACNYCHNSEGNAAMVLGGGNGHVFIP